MCNIQPHRKVLTFEKFYDIFIYINLVKIQRIVYKYQKRKLPSRLYRYLYIYILCQASLKECTKKIENTSKVFRTVEWIPSDYKEIGRRSLVFEVRCYFGRLYSDIWNKAGESFKKLLCSDKENVPELDVCISTYIRSGFWLREYRISHAWKETSFAACNQ